MSAIKTGIKAHDDTCFAAEMNRQAAVTAAIAAGGGTVRSLEKTAEISFYRSVIASCLANGLPSENFVFALQNLGTGGS